MPLVSQRYLKRWRACVCYHQGRPLGLKEVKRKPAIIPFIASLAGVTTGLPSATAGAAVRNR